MNNTKTSAKLLLFAICLLTTPLTARSQGDGTPTPIYPTYRGTVLRYLPTGQVLEGTLTVSIDPFGLLSGRLFVGGQEIPVLGQLIPPPGTYKGSDFYKELFPLPDGRGNPDAEKVPFTFNQLKISGGSLNGSGVVTAFRLIRL